MLAASCAAIVAGLGRCPALKPRREDGVPCHEAVSIWSSAAAPSATASTAFEADVGIKRRDHRGDRTRPAGTAPPRSTHAASWCCPAASMPCPYRAALGRRLLNADTFESATASAAFGGTTTVISFAAQHAACTDDGGRRLRRARPQGRGDRLRLPHDHRRSDRARSRSIAGADRARVTARSRCS